MLTIEDIRKPGNASGFSQVRSAGGIQRPSASGHRGVGGKPWSAFYGRGRKGDWRGPRRNTPEEAAQDYCDYVNGPESFMVIDDLQNDKRKSGFDHVSFKVRTVRDGDGYKPYQAESGAKPRYKGEITNRWSGPRRYTAEEAAQDYCDYKNSRSVRGAIPLKRPSVDRPPRKRTFDPSPELRELRRRARELETKEKSRLPAVAEDTYLIGERGSTYAVKIGKSKDQEWRPADLQTGNPRELYVIGFIKGGGEPVERALQQKYIKDNVLLEWFVPSPQLFEEFGVNYFEWMESLQGQIEAPESIAA